LYGAAVCIYKGKEKYRKQTLSHQKKSLEKQSVPCNGMLCKPDKAAAAVITAQKGIVMLQSISSCSKLTDTIDLAVVRYIFATIL
jgi:hypothetical protein